VVDESVRSILETRNSHCLIFSIVVA